MWTAQARAFDGELFIYGMDDGGQYLLPRVPSFSII